MNRRRFLKATAAIATGSVAILAGCANDTGGGADSTKTKSPTETNTVQMVSGSTSYYFDPIGLFVEKGETVTWKSKIGAHTSTAYVDGTGPATVTRIPNDASGWNSGMISGGGQQFEHTFDVPGTYDYFCIPHKSLGMVGRIVVGNPGGPAEGSMPPDGKVPTSQRIVNSGAVSYEDFTE